MLSSISILMELLIDVEVVSGAESCDRGQGFNYVEHYVISLYPIIFICEDVLTTGSDHRHMAALRGHMEHLHLHRSFTLTT